MDAMNKQQIDAKYSQVVTKVEKRVALKAKK